MIHKLNFVGTCHVKVLGLLKLIAQVQEGSIIDDP